jgi:serine/threonine protein kinase/tetratricopeptide (TPR) repeat protein
MGEVYEARDRLLQDSLIAIKTLSAELSSSADAQDRLEREILLARQVTHPNVCPIYQIDHHRDAQGVCRYLSMKLLPGETLAARLERDPALSTEEAGIVMRHIAGALHAAHRVQIIHRDIKPSNIMLDGSGSAIKAVVMDFGVARSFDSHLTVATAAHVLGTPAYMAPELLRGQPASAATDLYAFGLVLHEIYGGKMQDSGSAYLKLAPGVYSPGVPAFVARLITECLSDYPERRLRSFQQALVKLNLDFGQAPSAVPARPLWTRRRWLLAAGAAGCAVGGSTVWERDDINALLHPLPRKRFVALVNWPPSSDSQFAPVLSGVLDALEQELSRAEAFDHDLYVIPSRAVAKDNTELSKIPDSLGANLVLASSASVDNGGIRLMLKILDASAAQVLRQSVIRCALDEVTALPERAVLVAANFLGVGQFVKPRSRLNAGTTSPEAYRAFQAGEVFRDQPNDVGLDSAIAQYKIAVNQDSHYAIAHAMLGWTYGRLYWVRHDPAALDLAQANTTTALDLEPNLVAGHQVMGNIWFFRGNANSAIKEMERALSLDPSNPQSLIYTAQVYFQIGQFAKAEEMFRRVLAARPNYWLAYNYLGNVCKAQGKYQDAFRAFAAARLASPRNTFVLNDFGETALKLGLLKDSRESLEQSFSIRPSGVAAADLAQVLRAQGKYSQALTFALKAVALDPKDDELWREVGDCYNALPDHRAKALEAYSRAAEEAKSHLEINQTEGARWILLALYQAKLGNLSAVRLALNRAEVLGANDLDSLLTKARTLELMGKRQAALDTLTSCFQKGATKFEFGIIPDLQSLRADSRYLTIFHPKER